MQIKIEGHVYKLLCNECPVNPYDISLGERNIIGLCYFFTRILHGKNTATAYNGKYLIVIDDMV